MYFDILYLIYLFYIHTLILPFYILIFETGAPIIPRGPAQTANGRSEMINHALCMKKCKENNDDVALDKTVKLEKCLETCYVTYAPHLYSTLPQTK